LAVFFLAVFFLVAFFFAILVSSVGVKDEIPSLNYDVTFFMHEIKKCCDFFESFLSLGSRQQLDENDAMSTSREWK
jgi:hypothetical protein